MGDDKEKRMCRRSKKLAGDGSKDRIKKYAALVSDPRFLCLKCGRVSSKEDLLCKPRALPGRKD